MKTRKRIAKLLAQRVVALSLFSFMLFVVACKDDEPAPVIGEVEADVATFAVVNVPVTLLDKSNNAASRLWTIEGGTPATSTDKSAQVTFTTSGTKSVTLDVVFDNGTTNSSTFTVTVAEELNATISSTETVNFAMGDSDISVSMTFSAEVVGDPDGYSWSFSGGDPATSTEANPTVVWVGGGASDVSLTVSRSADGASLEVTGAVQAGPENLWTNDYWGFEGEDVVTSLQTWNGAINEPWAAGVLVGINDGYDGKAIEINFPGNDVYYGVISRDWWDSNAQLTSGDIVLFSYYAKAGTEGASLQFSRIVNHLPGWSIPDPADEQGFQVWNGTEPVVLGTDWTRITKIDTLDNLNYATANNVFPEFGFIGEAAVFSLDKVELKLLGNVND